jgi:hypothetical protein
MINAFRRTPLDTTLRSLLPYHERAMYTAPAIEALIRATLNDSATERERHFLHQSLLNLVRLAHAELRAEMQASVDKALQPVQAVLPA